MAFKFPLKTVLKHRKIKEDLAQKDFQDARAICDEQQRVLEQMKNQLHSSYLTAGSIVSSQNNPGPSLEQIHEFKKLQEIRISRQIEKIQNLEKIVEEKQEILRQAALEYKMMNRYRDKKLAEYKWETNKKEQLEIDEMNVLRFDIEEK